MSVWQYGYIYNDKNISSYTVIISQSRMSVSSMVLTFLWHICLSFPTVAVNVLFGDTVIKFEKSAIVGSIHHVVELTNPNPVL